ncbi:MAG TPA: hypothetical protein VH092_24335 [Urbifossiella sp.]|jgi:hypothetical protein|nr:hypothetical protein [Urbifossiella sp.]
MAETTGPLPDPSSIEGLPVSEYRAWLNRRWEDASKRAAAVCALDAYEALAGRADVTAEEIAPVVEAARSPAFVSWDIGLRFLCRLGARYEVARQAMRELAQGSHAKLRGWTVASLHDRLPKESCLEMVRRGLTDRSRGVRMAAAGAGLWLLLRELLPDLDAAIQAEQHPITRLELERSTGLLRDGFFLYPGPGGTRQLVVRATYGVPLNLCWLGPPWCPEVIKDAEEARVYADEFRRQRGGVCRSRPLRWDEKATEPVTPADGYRTGNS